MKTTQRKWPETPEKVKLETKAGPLWLLANGPDTLYATNNPDGGGPIFRASYMTIRGVTYSVTAHMQYVPADVRAAEGTDDAGKLRVAKGWRVNPAEYTSSSGKAQNWGYRAGLYMSRQPWQKANDVSSAARVAAIDIVETAVNAWAATPGADEHIRAGVTAALGQDNFRDEGKIAELEAEAAALRAKVRERDARIAKLAR